MGRAVLCAGRRALALGADPRRDERRDGLRAPGRLSGRGAASAGRHDALVADRPDGHDRRARHGSAARGGGRAGEALRRHDRGLSAQPAATQGRRGGGDPLRRPLLVAHRAGRRSGGGAALARCLVCRGRRPASPWPAYGRCSGGGGAALAAAGCRVSGRAAGGAGRLGERARLVRGQPLQRPTRSGRPDGDGACPGWRAAARDRLRRGRLGRDASAGAGRRRSARPLERRPGRIAAGGAGCFHHQVALRAQAKPAAIKEALALASAAAGDVEIPSLADYARLAAAS